MLLPELGEELLSRLGPTVRNIVTALADGFAGIRFSGKVGPALGVFGKLRNRQRFECGAGGSLPAAASWAASASGTSKFTRMQTS